MVIIVLTFMDFCLARLHFLNKNILFGDIKGGGREKKREERRGREVGVGSRREGRKGEERGVGSEERAGKRRERNE